MGSGGACMVVNDELMLLALAADTTSLVIAAKSASSM